MCIVPTADGNCISQLQSVISYICFRIRCCRQNQVIVISRYCRILRIHGVDGMAVCCCLFPDRHVRTFCYFRLSGFYVSRVGDACKGYTCTCLTAIHRIFRCQRQGMRSCIILRLSRIRIQLVVRQPCDFYRIGDIFNLQAQRTIIRIDAAALYISVSTCRLALNCLQLGHVDCIRIFFTGCHIGNLAGLLCSLSSCRIIPVRCTAHGNRSKSRIPDWVFCGTVGIAVSNSFC